MEMRYSLNMRGGGRLKQIIDGEQAIHAVIYLYCPHSMKSSLSACSSLPLSHPIMPGKNRFASLQDPEDARRMMEQRGLGNSIPHADADQGLTTGVIEERVRRPYASIPETIETFDRPRARPPTVSPLSTNAQGLLQDNPLINAIIESSRAQVESMAAEIMQWKRTVDEKDAELAYLRDATRRLMAERQEFDDQIKAIRRIVEVKPEGRELPPLRQSQRDPGVKVNSKSEETTPSGSTLHSAHDNKPNGTLKPQTQSQNKPQTKSSTPGTQDDKARRTPNRYYKPRKPNNPAARTETRLRRAKTIFDLPKEAIERIVRHLSPPLANPLLRADPIYETSPLFDDSWNTDLEHWAGTCMRFSRILRGNYRWKVVRFDDEDPIGWHERVERMPPRIRPFVQ